MIKSQQKREREFCACEATTCLANPKKSRVLGNKMILTTFPAPINSNRLGLSSPIGRYCRFERANENYFENRKRRE